MKNFKKFVAIDWSGAKSPIKTRAIAVSSCDGNAGVPSLLSGPGNGLWSRKSVCDWIGHQVDSGTRTLIGMDCNFGYAQAVMQKQFGPAASYRNLWQAVEEACHTEENFFAGPYWKSCPDLFWSEGTMPSGFRMERRVTETTCHQAGFGTPESPFKLIGAKQVGKGGLAGMRVARYLKERWGDAICIWPFERSIASTAHVVVTEIYPRLFLMQAGHGKTKIRTVPDLNAVLRGLGSAPLRRPAISDHEADALAAAVGLRHFCGSGREIPDDLSNPPVSDRILQAEGWIFGAGYRA